MVYFGGDLDSGIQNTNEFRENNALVDEKTINLLERMRHTCPDCGDIINVETVGTHLAKRLVLSCENRDCQNNKPSVIPQFFKDRKIYYANIVATYLSMLLDA